MLVQEVIERIQRGEKLPRKVVEQLRELGPAFVERLKGFDQALSESARTVLALQKPFEERLRRFYETLYHQERNGLFAWAAYEYHRKRGQPIPPWVLGYFDRAAAGIAQLTANEPSGARNLSTGPHPKRRTKNIAPVVMKALDLNWQVVKNFDRWQTKYLQALGVSRLVREGYKPYLAVEKVAKQWREAGWKVGKETIRTAYEELRALFPVQRTQ